MDSDKPHYILVPRKAVVAIVTIFVCLMAGTITSFQYANYVDRKSNGQWCELVVALNDSYVEIPPTTDLGKRIANALLDLNQEFKCTR